MKLIIIFIKIIMYKAVFLADVLHTLSYSQHFHFIYEETEAQKSCAIVIPTVHQMVFCLLNT